MTTTAEKQTMYQGEKKILRFTIVNADAAGEPPLDLTNFSVRWALSKQGDAGYQATPVLAKSTGSGGVVITNAVGGVVEVTLLKVDTQAIGLGTYHQELEVVDALNEIAVVAVGEIEMLRNVVNP